MDLATSGNMPSRSGRRGKARSRTRAERPRRRAMRISERILSIALFGCGLGLATAYAFDGTRTPSDISPAVGIEMVQQPRGAGTKASAGLTAPATPQQGGGFSLQSLPRGNEVTSLPQNPL